MPAASPAIDRFWSKVDVSGDCWLWTAALRADGYARFAPVRRASVPAHRFAYESLVGPVDPTLEFDHLCRIRHCVNPAHLEPVTKAENLRRAGAAVTHCRRGHEYSVDNTEWRDNGRGLSRRCRTCHRDRERARHHGDIAAIRAMSSRTSPTCESADGRTRP